MPYHDRIVSDPAICGGQPVVRGTRVLVRVLLGYLAHEEPMDVILREFPSLKEEDVRAVISFAAASASEDLPVRTLGTAAERETVEVALDMIAFRRELLDGTEALVGLQIDPIR